MELDLDRWIHEVIKIKTLTYLTMLVLLAGLVSAVTVETGVEFDPGCGGSFYVLNMFSSNEINTSAWGLNINLSDGKNLALKNNGTLCNLSLTNIGPYNQIYNQTRLTEVESNVNSYSTEVSTGNRTFLFDYDTTTQSFFDEISLSITNVAYGYDTALDTLYINRTGTGTVELIAMRYIAGA